MNSFPASVVGRATISRALIRLKSCKFALDLPESFVENAPHPDATSVYGGPCRSPAMISCQLRQARKGATVAVTSCAGVLAGRECLHYLLPPSCYILYFSLLFRLSLYPEKQIVYWNSLADKLDLLLKFGLYQYPFAGRLTVCPAE